MAGGRCRASSCGRVASAIASVTISFCASSFTCRRRPSPHFPPLFHRFSRDNKRFVTRGVAFFVLRLKSGNAYPNT